MFAVVKGRERNVETVLFMVQVNVRTAGQNFVYATAFARHHYLVVHLQAFENYRNPRGVSLVFRAEQRKSVCAAEYQTSVGQHAGSPVVELVPSESVSREVIGIGQCLRVESGQSVQGAYPKCPLIILFYRRYVCTCGPGNRNNASFQFVVSEQSVSYRAYPDVAVSVLISVRGNEKRGFETVGPVFVIYRQVADFQCLHVDKFYLVVESAHQH